MKLKPNEDRVIIRPDEPLTQTKSGLHIPAGDREKPSRGIVLAVGPGVRRLYTDAMNPVKFVPGDKVLFTQYAGTDVDYDGVPVKIMREGDILAQIEE